MNVKNYSIIKFDDGEIVGVFRSNDSTTVIINENGWIGEVDTNKLVANKKWTLLSEHNYDLDLLVEMGNISNK